MNKDPNQIIHDLRQDNARLSTELGLVKRQLQEEVKEKYAAYTRIGELTARLSNVDEYILKELEPIARAGIRIKSE